MTIADLYLIRPSRYDDDGYPLQWWRSMVPSNSTACVSGLVRDCLARKALGDDVDMRIHEIDEANDFIDPKTIVARARTSGRQQVVFLIGVQSNQYPRALDLARPLRAAGIPVCIGGFHVSGCLSMLKTIPAELQEALDLGVSLFAGEAEEGRIDEVLRDALGAGLKPIYNHLKSTPGLEGAPIPLLHPETVARNFTGFSSFDLGRGCPYQCSFCTIINVQGRKSRFRSPDDLEAIIRQNAAIGISRFFLTDDNFARNKIWEPLLDRLIELRADGLKVRLAVQVDTLAHRIPNFIDKCAKAGADQIFIGLETINSDSLASAKKGQNRIEEYKTMVQAWKKRKIFLTAGYIIGFPNDTYQSVMRDIDILKRELALDTIYLNYLTPLPGSEDHRRMIDNGTWMDPDLNRYDLNHRVTHHPIMTDAEWEAAYRDAHASFYSWEHMETIFRRMAGFKSQQKLTTIFNLVGYRESLLSENCARVESGLIRIKRRRQRRSGLPLENPLIFYPRYFLHVANSAVRAAVTAYRLRRMLGRVLADPDRASYRDAAMIEEGAGNDDSLVAVTRGGAEAAEHRRQVAAVTGRR
ncbi:MAG: radical SAM protein [Hyphomicrobiaceae bacterium]|nr:radical SAM protein [Hyphomicrobiaceae bacterium]